MIRDFLDSDIALYAQFPMEDDDARYIDAFWIAHKDLSPWFDRVGSVFDRSHSGLVTVKPGRQMERQLGGILFVEEEFLTFVARAKATGAERFAIIEDAWPSDWSVDRRFYRFCYPIDVTWEEMTRPGSVTQDVFERPIRCYFVITDNARVGKYADNDDEDPYDLIFHD